MAVHIILGLGGAMFAMYVKMILTRQHIILHRIHENVLNYGIQLEFVSCYAVREEFCLLNLEVSITYICRQLHSAEYISA